MVLPEEGYEIWICAQLTDNPTYGTYGGHASFDISGAGAAAGLRWDQIHDPSSLADDSPELEQYWRQIDHMVHELPHVWGAGIGEYCSLSIIEDVTAIEPIMNVRYTNWHTDPFWQFRNDYIADPLRQNIRNNSLVGSVP